MRLVGRSYHPKGGTMKTITIMLAVVLTAAACSDGQATTIEAPSTAASVTTPAAPVCSLDYAVGVTIDGDPEACLVGDTFNSAAAFSCTDGTKLTQFDAHDEQPERWVVTDGEVMGSDGGAVADDPTYGEAVRACSQATGEPAEEAVEDGTDVEQTTTTVAETTTSAEPSPTLVEIEAAALTLADMPEGWIDTSAAFNSDDGDDSDDCAALGIAEQFDDAEQTDAVVYGAGDFGPFFGQNFIVFDSSGDASDAIEGVVQAIEACNPSSDADGNVTTFSPMNLDERLDGAFAVAMQVEGGFAPVDARLVVVRKGNAVLYAFGVGLGGLDVEQFMERLDLAVDRFDRV